MESVKQILMRRDGMTEAEAQERWEEVECLIQETMNNECDILMLESIIEDELGLEPDYLVEFM